MNVTITITEQDGHLLLTQRETLEPVGRNDPEETVTTFDLSAHIEAALERIFAKNDLLG